MGRENDIFAGKSLLQPTKAKRVVPAGPEATSEARQQSLAQREAMTRYFDAARALYLTERCDHMWKSLENPYGFSSHNTSETLRQLLSPLRSVHVLDQWTPMEVYLFEVGIQRFGKQFHLIQTLVPRKATRDVIAFYYIWKKFGLPKATWMQTAPTKDPFGMKIMKLERQKHGIQPTAYDLLSDGDDDTVLAVKRQSLAQATKKRRIDAATASTPTAAMTATSAKNHQRMHDVHAIVAEYFDAVRALYAPVVPDTQALDAALKQWGLDGATVLRPAVALLSPLRPAHVLGAHSWTPYELTIFEVGLELYGKHFHYVAQLLPQKATSDVIALYYVWKPINALYEAIKRKRPQPQ
ncbi:hypothetical protein ACHHYP_15026 [Achlya hypogyna]|uniref:SANT domain-containing protein n=1 Tax=Achlya hypogyna TaxID=1202772 RepID=A0A1V9YBR4_ACHHY|nr:hypothetical protein ACHHYP_15026 [Achlya hypogyna]